ncbi:MAG: ABC-2 type transport system permease protein [Candidatus Nanohaloarchaea archaeon]|jgi:ABC-2 type transport system permease protein
MDVMKHLKIYWMYFWQYWKSRLVYRTDFILGFTAQAISLATSLAFLTLIFTQVENINGWTFNQMLFLAGLGGFIMNLHHVFLFNVYRLGEAFVVKGKMDRLLVRPLNPLFQVYADDVSDNNLSKLIVNAALILYASSQMSLKLGLTELVYGFLAVASGVMVFAGIYLLFATTAFWTGKSRSAMWLVFQLSDFRKYPYGIYQVPVQVLLITLVPLAFASFFPATFFLGKDGWQTWQIASLAVGPIFYTIAYSFWKFGLSRYSSTGS